MIKEFDLVARTYMIENFNLLYHSLDVHENGMYVKFCNSVWHVFLLK